MDFFRTCRRRYIVVAIALVTGLSHFAHAKSDCEFFLNNSTLVEALHKAIADDYRVEIFAKEVDGKNKVLVLMGETHIKSPTSAAIGRNVVKEFDYVGFEGFERKKTWGGKLSASVIDPIIKRLGINKAPQFWLARNLGRLYGAKGRTEGSTIIEAHVAEIRNSFFEYIKSQTPDKRKELIAALETTADESRDAILEFQGVKLFSARELLDLVKSVANGDESVQVGEQSGPKETVHLEKGHVPNLTENWYSIENYVTWGILAAYYAMASFIPDNYQRAFEVALISYTLYSFTCTVLGTTKYKAAKWYQGIFR